MDLGSKSKALDLTTLGLWLIQQLSRQTSHHLYQRDEVVSDRKELKAHLH